RALRSMPPPAANGTTSVIGRVGQSCAEAAPAKPSRRDTATTAVRIMIVFLVADVSIAFSVACPGPPTRGHRRAAGHDESAQGFSPKSARPRFRDAKAGTQDCTVSRMPACAGMSGGCGSVQLETKLAPAEQALDVVKLQLNVGRPPVVALAGIGRRL